MSAPQDLTGMRFGRLTAERVDGRNSTGHLLWVCKCTCGRRKKIASNQLAETGRTRSCGCLRSDVAKARVAESGTWNAGKRYHIRGGEHVYRSLGAWAKAVIRERGNRCERCGWDMGRCDAHHRVPKSKGGLNTISNGEVLCPNHHRIEH